MIFVNCCQYYCGLSSTKFVQFLLVFILGILISHDFVYGFGTLSPRVVHTKQTQWQGVLGPENIHIGYTHGIHPIVEVSELN